MKKAKLQFIDLIHELIQDVVSGQLFDGLAVDEQHRLALAAGNADVCFAGFTGPLTTQPITATLMDFLQPCSRFSTSLAIWVQGYWVRPQVGQVMTSGPATGKPTARRML